jgi:hypothetical protein
MEDAARDPTHLGRRRLSGPPCNPKPSADLASNPRESQGDQSKLKPVAPTSRKGLPSDAAVHQSLSSLGRPLRGPGETASIRFRLATGGRELARIVVVSPGQAEVVSESPGGRISRLSCRGRTGGRSLAPRRPPAAVFLMGRMRLRDCQLARRLYRHVAAAKGSAAVLA